jgi:acyl-CoA reductase-like NAD-dependent aldehyde dehydrogenase
VYPGNLVPDYRSTSKFRNLTLSLAAGNATIWKPSPSTPLCSIALTKIISSVLERNNIPGAVASLVTGGKDVGEALVESRDVELGWIFLGVLWNHRN